MPIVDICRDHHRATLALTLAAFGCGGKAAPPLDPTPVVFEDRLVISDTDDKSPLPVPPEQLPKPGECRLWRPTRPLREQAHAGSCAEIETSAPPESWVLYRPGQDPRLVQVRIIDPNQPGLITQIRVYDAARGTYLGSKQRREHH
ncbi:MAG TPA: hypothetical protein VIG95_06055 [Gemmatimonadales bacterium]